LGTTNESDQKGITEMIQLRNPTNQVKQEKQ